LDLLLLFDLCLELHKSGAVNSVRLPIGDFMYKPYGPYREYWQIILSILMVSDMSYLHFSC
jgi:hypothetical protein